MSFSRLTTLTQEEYQRLNLIAFREPPKETSSGNPDPSVTVNLGGWVSDTVLAFTLTTTDESGLELTIDPTLDNTLDINLIACGDCEPSTSYYTVDVGSDDGRTTDWQVSYQVQSQGTNTGTWVFKKGGVGDDELLSEAPGKKYN